MIVLTWLWRQQRPRFKYTAEHVNVWAKAIRDNTTLDIELACVTDEPKGIESWIKIIKPPQDFTDISVYRWGEHRGMPQCFRRLAMFSPEAADVFGKRFACIDLDMVVMGNLDKILGCTDDFRMLESPSQQIRPYNGSLIVMDAGARPQVYTKFNQKNAEIACENFVGSDQAWISHCLGWGEKTFTYDDFGVAFLTRTRLKRFRHIEADEANIVLGFFPGKPKFFMNGDCHKALDYEIKIMNRLYGQELWDIKQATTKDAMELIRIPKKKKSVKSRRIRLNRL